MVAILVLSDSHTGDSANISCMTVQLSLTSSLLFLELSVGLFTMKKAEQAVLLAVMLLLFALFLLHGFLFLFLLLVKQLFVLLFFFLMLFEKSFLVLLFFFLVLFLKSLLVLVFCLLLPLFFLYDSFLLRCCLLLRVFLRKLGPSCRTGTACDCCVTAGMAVLWI